MSQFSYQLTSVAHKRLKKLPQKIQIRLIKKLKYFCATNPLAYADKLTDRWAGEFRFRVGNYRIIFDIHDDQITVLDVGHRRDIYR